ncbi:MAG: ABC transporter ATP-binding protein [Selenomonadaceae bacterium]|nr:ABC transporter ATP-binding protein [Selenomonadaceae bacterium]
MKQELIRLENVVKTFGSLKVLDEINLTVHENEFVTLLGPSGCGKTTLLRIIGGFETPDSGQILFDGKDITSVPPNRRPINTVFQKYSLFSHMSVAENIAFGPKIAGKPADYIADKVKYALKLVNLSGYENNDVTKLSGGQQQRIAIARAIVNEPKVLLLDEPLSALDLKLRRAMRNELVRINRETGITFIFVTHDQEEALSMSDTIVVMNQGYIQQIGTPEEVYNEPENAFVADFIGDSNIIDGVMVRDKLVRILDREYPCVDVGFPPECSVDVQIRPEDITLGAPDENALNGTVTRVVFWGMSYDITVDAGGFKWLVQSIHGREVGERVSLNLDPYNIQIMSKPQSEDEEVAKDV